MHGLVIYLFKATTFYARIILQIIFPILIQKIVQSTSVNCFLEIWILHSTYQACVHFNTASYVVNKIVLVMEQIVAAMLPDYIFVTWSDGIGSITNDNPESFLLFAW